MTMTTISTHYKTLSTLTSYPTFLEYENTLTKTPYNVKEWYNYLTDIDEALTTLYDYVQEHAVQKRGTSQRMRSVHVFGRDVGELEALSEVQGLRRCRIVVAERALALLPGSYKLWRMHLSYLCGTCEVPSKTIPMASSLINPDNGEYCMSSSDRFRRYKQVVSAFERALVRMNKFPRIWLEYMDFVIGVRMECSVTNIRRLWDRCLCALPVTQHELVWEKYIKWTLACVRNSIASSDHDCDIKEMALRIFRRHSQYDPSFREDLADMCSGSASKPIENGSSEQHIHNSDYNIDLSSHGEAAKIYQDLLNDPDYTSPRGTTRSELWQKLCVLCSAHPVETKAEGVDFEYIIRSALDDSNDYNIDPIEGSGQHSNSFFNEVRGTLYLHLARYYTHAGLFNKVRSIYAEAITGVNTVRDFTLAFDSAIQFEEGVCSALMDQMNPDELEMIQDTDNSEKNESTRSIGLNDLLPVDADNDTRSKSDELNWTLSRLEMLLEKRPLMLNRVLLRQNPHNVGEWLKRAELMQVKSKSNAARALEEACGTVASNLSVNGNPANMWIQLAKIYHENDEIEEAKDAFQRALKYKFQTIDDLATVHASRVDYLLELEDWDDALANARRAVSGKSKLAYSVQSWVTLLDLEEALGTLQTTKAAYSRCMESGMANVQICMNYTEYLWQKNFFEESFTIFEKALDLFPQPEKQKHIWGNYLSKFRERYILPYENSEESIPSAKLERLRELYERCVTTLPANLSGEQYLNYAKLEEKYGLMQRALNIYERLCLASPSSKEKHNAYQLYIIVAARALGSVKTRPIFEAAIAALDDLEASHICTKYATLETQLGEIQRARSLWVYGAQMADPRRNPDYWKKWHAFEVEHGNEETFREMLRIKRGVVTAFSSVNYNAAEMGTGLDEPKTLTDEEAFRMIAEREGLDTQNTTTSSATAVEGFVTGSKRKAVDAGLDSLERQATKLREATGNRERAVTADEGEIDLDEDDDNDRDQSNIADITTKSVPTSVFGALVQDTVQNDSDKGSISINTGTLEKLRAAAANHE